MLFKSGKVRMHSYDFKWKTWLHVSTALKSPDSPQSMSGNWCLFFVFLLLVIFEFHYSRPICHCMRFSARVDIKQNDSRHFIFCPAKKSGSVQEPPRSYWSFTLCPRDKSTLGSVFQFNGSESSRSDFSSCWFSDETVSNPINTENVPQLQYQTWKPAFYSASISLLMSSYPPQ